MRMESAMYCTICTEPDGDRQPVGYERTDYRSWPAGEMAAPHIEVEEWALIDEAGKHVGTEQRHLCRACGHCWWEVDWNV